MQTRKIFISAGHSNVSKRDTGAVGINGVKEGDLTVELRKLVVDELLLLNQNVIVDPDSFVTKETVVLIKSSLTARDIAVDIHFNAYSELVRGTEVLVPFKSSAFEKELAKNLVDSISACLCTRNRGVKTEANSFLGRLLFMTPNCENILIEVCFITNKFDMLAYLMKKHYIAKIIAKCIYDSVNK